MGKGLKMMVVTTIFIKKEEVMLVATKILEAP